MSILVARDIEKSWGERMVLTGCDVRIGARDRVGLVGANGCGKSTLLQVLCGAVDADSGELHVQGTVALLSQAPDLVGETVADAAAAAVAWHANLLNDYERALAEGDEALAATLQDRLDDRGWSVDHLVSGVLDRVGAPDPAAVLSRLSGGERRRVALATTLLQQPDLLVLDEPTNHLDLQAATWLESYLQGYRGAVLLVTHDRYLLEAVAERIVEVEGGVTVGYEGSYGDYLVARAERQVRLADARDRRLRLIAQEAAWAARSPSARTTKQKARLQRLDKLRDTVPELHERSYSFRFESGIHQGTTLLQGRNLHKSLGSRVLVGGLDFELRPKERLGIIGPNGTGKTTLLRMITNSLAPDQGEVERYSKASLGLLDQERTGLDPSDTVIDAVADGHRHVRIWGQDVAVQGFLGYFAFPREAFEQKVSALSGGERARLMLARLMLQGHAILCLDEPTNDLDLLTLRVLEQALLDFDGGAIIVTHDRAFLDRVCTGLLVFEGDGRVAHYADRHQAERAAREGSTAAEPARDKPKPTPKPKAKDTTRLTWKERKELDGLPELLEQLEAEQAQVEQALASPETYRDGGNPAALTKRLDALRDEIAVAYARWEELELRI